MSFPQQLTIQTTDEFLVSMLFMASTYTLLISTMVICGRMLNKKLSDFTEEFHQEQCRHNTEMEKLMIEQMIGQEEAEVEESTTSSTGKPELKLSQSPLAK